MSKVLAHKTRDSLHNLKLSRKKAKNRKRAKKRKSSRWNKTQFPKDKSFSKNVFNYSSLIMSGECFWKNYMSVCNWQKNYNRFIITNDFHSPYLGMSRSRSVSTPQANFHKQTMRMDEMVLTYSESEDPTENIEDEVSEDEYVVTEEMMKFLEISMRHKAEMKLKKENESAIKKKATSERDNRVECMAPTERTIDAKRLEEMKELYGSSAAMIMGMETAIQLTFNRNCDKNKPSFWPILPLIFKFS